MADGMAVVARKSAEMRKHCSTAAVDGLICFQRCCRQVKWRFATFKRAVAFWFLPPKMPAVFITLRFRHGGTFNTG
jgi:hypothetical protein